MRISCNCTLGCLHAFHRGSKAKRQSRLVNVQIWMWKKIDIYDVNYFYVFFSRTDYQQSWTFSYALPHIFTSVSHRLCTRNHRKSYDLTFLMVRCMTVWNRDWSSGFLDTIISNTRDALRAVPSFRFKRNTPSAFPRPKDRVGSLEKVLRRYHQWFKMKSLLFFTHLIDGFFSKRFRGKQSLRYIILRDIQYGAGSTVL